MPSTAVRDNGALRMWPAPLRVHIGPAACTDFSKITGEFKGSLGAMWASPPTNVPEGFPNKKILPSLYWDESTEDTSWCHPNSKSAALPPFRADGAGPGDFEKISYTPARRMSFAQLAAEIFQRLISSLSGVSALLLPRPCGYEMLSASFWT